MRIESGSIRGEGEIVWVVMIGEGGEVRYETLGGFKDRKSRVHYRLRRDKISE